MISKKEKSRRIIFVLKDSDITEVCELQKRQPDTIGQSSNKERRQNLLYY